MKTRIHRTMVRGAAMAALTLASATSVLDAEENAANIGDQRHVVDRVALIAFVFWGILGLGILS
jgi:hypothetical protein